MPPCVERNRRTMIYDIVVKRTFDERMEDSDHLISVFNDHNFEVQRTIAPERLLTYDAAHGWQPLCEFLDVPVPDQSYPLTNTAAEFKESARDRARELAKSGGS